MMRGLFRPSLFLSALAASLAFGSPAEAQFLLPSAFEIRRGYAAENPRAENGQGSGWDASTEYNVEAGLIGMFSLYGGYARYGYEMKDADPLRASGLSAGLRAELPLPLNPWVRGGLTYHSTRQGEVRFRRVRGQEWGAGLSVPMGMFVFFSPGVRLIDFEAPGLEGDPRRVQAIVFDAAVRYHW